MTSYTFLYFLHMPCPCTLVVCCNVVDPIPDMMDYGFLQAAAREDTETLLVVSREAQSILPTHTFLSFSVSDIGEDFSKLYVMNMVWTPDTAHQSKGIA